MILVAPVIYKKVFRFIAVQRCCQDKRKINCFYTRKAKRLPALLLQHETVLTVQLIIKRNGTHSTNGEKLLFKKFKI
jgi:hypothetical protein